MSHKIKLNLDKKSKSLEDLPNQKISISLDGEPKKNLLSKEKKTERIIQKKDKVRSVTYDNQLFKQFKNALFFKIDLHGLTLEEAHKRLTEYFKENYKRKKLLHIVITGLGNKSKDGEFFTGKIRKMFPIWLEDETLKRYVKSYSPCKIQHGGLGAYYVKLKIKE